MNSTGNRGTGGCSVDGSRHYRFQICSENKIIETLPHIRVACTKTELLRNSSHHRVHTSIADLFRQKNIFEVYEKVHRLSMIDSNAQNRRSDIIIIDKSKKRGLVLDQKICWETNDL